MHLPNCELISIISLMFMKSQRKLNDTYTGGLGSFVLCAMIASFLQMRKRLERRRKVQLTWNLGALLVELFHLYGNTFNYMHTGISIKDGGLFFRKRERKDWENPNRFAFGREYTVQKL